MIYNVQDYGAIGDGSHNDSSAIQAAIDACFANGGGRVVLSNDHIYRSGTIILRSNVDFHIEQRAVLKASDNIKDFDIFSKDSASSHEIKVPTYENCEYQGCPTLFFLYAKDEDNISLSGEGTIDGNEEIFYGEITPWHIDGSFYPRVPLMFFEHVKGLNIRDLTLCKSAFWTVHPIGCENVTIDNLFINNNLRLANCDGIDPDHCKDVSIKNCRIISADDCIVFKNTHYGSYYGPCENITVDNCYLTSTSAAIKFGTESEDVFRNITISNCEISNSNRGISIQLRDSGSVEDVHFENINIDCHMFSQEHWWGDGEPIALTAVARKSDTHVGRIRNISFNNITCNCENGIMIYGDKATNINNISFSDLHMLLISKTGEIRSSRDLRPCEETPSVASHPLCFYAHHAGNISVKNFIIDAQESLADTFKPYVEIEGCNSTYIDWKLK
ncbi:MAG: glycoside hydrolase family 28 protein [Lachnospiraceae bacterium]|nr:glycoside hydrolase family 28 protein [Lachnospiraceae bacterium]